MFLTPIVSRRSVHNGHGRTWAGAFSPISSVSPLWRTTSLLDEVFQPVSAQRGVQIDTDDKGWQLSVDVPGLAREHLTITIDERVVSIESKADAPRAVKAAWQFAEDIDATASSARLENGVLQLKLARKAPVSTATVLSID